MWLYGWLLLLAGATCALHIPHRHQNGRHVQRVDPNVDLKYANMLAIRAKMIPLNRIDRPQDSIGRIRRDILAVHRQIALFLKNKRVKYVIVKRQANNLEIENKLLEAKLKNIADKLIKIIIKFAEDEPRNDIAPKIFANVTSNVVNDSSDWANVTDEPNVRSNVASDLLSNISVVNSVPSNNSNVVVNNVPLGNFVQANSILVRKDNENQTVNSVPQQADVNETDSSLRANNVSVENQQQKVIAFPQLQNNAIQQPLGQNFSVVQTLVTKEAINVVNNAVDVNNGAAKQQLQNSLPVRQSFIKKRSYNSEDEKERRNMQKKKKIARKISKQIKKHAFRSYVPMKQVAKRNFDAIHTNIEQLNSKNKRHIPLMSLLPGVFNNVHNFINGTINGIFPKAGVANNPTLFRHTSIDSSLKVGTLHSEDRPLPYTVKDAASNVQQLSEDGNKLVPGGENTADANKQR